MSYATFKSGSAVLRGRVISYTEATVKLMVEGELFFRVMDRKDVTIEAPHPHSGRRARSRRPIVGGPKSGLRRGS